MKHTLACRSPGETLAVGETLGRAARPGQVFALQGDLGTGKTLLTKGIAKGLGVPEWRYVTSPTFAMHNIYEGRLRLHHVDLYRLREDQLVTLETGLDLPRARFPGRGHSPRVDVVERQVRLLGGRLELNRCSDDGVRHRHGVGRKANGRPQQSDTECQELN